MQIVVIKIVVQDDCGGNDDDKRLSDIGRVDDEGFGDDDGDDIFLSW